MRYEDAITVSTPEGVDLDLPLAGLGSRFTATLLDWILKGALIAALFLGLGALAGDTGAAEDTGGGDVSGAVAFSIVIAAIFLVTFFYDVLFEVLGRGRTPGKRLAGLRVVETGGAPVGLRASAVRNLLRLVDGLPFSYVPAVISILVTRRNQRIGDLVAGTLVVREPARAEAGAAAGRQLASVDAAGVEASAVTAADLALVREFLERRDRLTGAARARLAADLAARLRPRVTDPAPPAGDEAFLERVAAAKSRRASG